MKNKNWRYGEKRELAQLAGISEKYLNAILNGKRNAGRSTAVKLELASKKLGKFISRHDWIFSKETSNPLFTNAKNVISETETVMRRKKNVSEPSN